MGRFTVDGTNTVSSQIELSAIVKSQAQKFATIEKSMLEAGESFEKTLEDKESAIDCLR